MDDAEALFLWRNDETTRMNSRTTNTIGWKEHLSWLEKSVRENPTRDIYIVENNGIPVGSMRTDLHDDGSYEISWTVAPSARGMGIGKAMVVEFVKTFLAGKKYHAVIEKGNVPSEKMALAIGLSEAERLASESPSDQRIFMAWR